MVRLWLYVKSLFVFVFTIAILGGIVWGIITLNKNANFSPSIQSLVIDKEQTMFVVTKDGELLRLYDKGKTWHKVLVIKEK